MKPSSDENLFGLHTTSWEALKDDPQKIKKFENSKCWKFENSIFKHFDKIIDIKKAFLDEFEI